jgi:hypothetical protein
MVLNTTAHTNGQKAAPKLVCRKRVKLASTLQSSQNQAHRAGYLGPSAALSARIEHNSEHNFPAHTMLVLQNPQPRRNKKGGEV